MSISKKSELNNPEFSPEFFYDEVREGFYVPTMMKRYWASQIKVLSIIARICDEHGIKWFADCGTLLGAVRHGGYVPWDDDLDICMLRDDWLRFFEVAEKELPAGFKVLTIDRELEYNEIIGRVVNSSAIDYSKEHLDQWYGCPYTVGIDVFPLDGLYDDPEKESDRKRRAAKALSELDKARDAKRIKELTLKVERIYSECSTSEASKVALMPFYAPRGSHVYPKELFKHTVKIPFEETYINAPGRYEEVLNIEYGDFLQVRKGGGIHEYPCYAEQERILRDNIGRNPFRYTFDAKELLGSVSRYAMRTLGKAGGQVVSNGNPGRLGDNAVPGDKKVVAFLPCRASWWGTMEPLWQKYSEDDSVEVHVLPIFYFDCDHNGAIGEKHDERDLFPEYLKVEACEKFDFAGIHPDVIVTQVPYDGFSTAFTVHEFFYSANLQKFTDELVYVPCFDMDAPVDENDKAATAIAAFIEQEAVINSDRVILGSEGLRKLYINKLVELSGEDTRQYWEQKIVVLESEDTAENRPRRQRKKIMYYVSISSFFRYGSTAIEKIRESFEIFEEAGDRIDATFVPQENLLENLKVFDPELYSEFETLIESIRSSRNISYEPGHGEFLQMEDIDAYYGDASPYVRKWIERKIPVMIQNYDIRKN